MGRPSERHTRQGVARGQKHGTLDREDPYVGYEDHWAATSHSGMKEQGRVPRAQQQKLHVIAGPGCWCGRPSDHTWPGQKQGAPHPREEQP